MTGSDQCCEYDGKKQIKGQRAKQKLFSVHSVADESADGGEERHGNK